MTQLSANDGKTRDVDRRERRMTGPVKGQGRARDGALALNVTALVDHLAKDATGQVWAVS